MNLKNVPEGLRTTLEETDIVAEGLECFLHDPSGDVYQGFKKVRGSITLITDETVPGEI